MPPKPAGNPNERPTMNSYTSSARNSLANNLAVNTSGGQVSDCGYLMPTANRHAMSAAYWSVVACAARQWAGRLLGQRASAARPISGAPR